MDTLHSDYAFIISPAPEHRMTFANEPDTLNGGWDFGLYPNPADKVLNLIVPDDVVMDIAIYDLTGRRAKSWSSVTGPNLRLSFDGLARGAYYVRVSDGEHKKTKELIIR